MGFWYGNILSTAGCQPHVDQPGTWVNRKDRTDRCMCVTHAYSPYQYCCDCKSCVEEGVCHIDWWKSSLHGQSIFRMPQADLQSDTHTYRQTKNQSLSPSAWKDQQKQSVLNFLPPHYRRIGVTFRQGGRSLCCQARWQGNSIRNARGNKNNVLGFWRHVHRSCVQSEATECIH